MSDNRFHFCSGVAIAFFICNEYMKLISGMKCNVMIL